jgi:hypothetical protein
MNSKALHQDHRKSMLLLLLFIDGQLRISVVDAIALAVESLHHSLQQGKLVKATYEHQNVHRAGRWV